MSARNAASEANAGQEAYWNSSVGENWALFQESLDHFHKSAADRLLARARPLRGERVLDIGCGAGATSIDFASAVGPSGSVVGIDISRVLLDRAEARREREGLMQIEYLLADAQTHAFEPERFDLLVSRFGVMFFSDPVAAFRNLRSALRKGGRMAFACWAPASENPWFVLPRDAAVSVLGEPKPAPPCAPGPLAFSEIDYVIGILRGAEFDDCRVSTEAVDLFHPGGIKAVMKLASVVGPAPRVIRELEGGPEEVAEINRRIAQSLRQFVVDEGIRIPASVHIFSAVRR